MVQKSFYSILAPVNSFVYPEALARSCALKKLLCKFYQDLPEHTRDPDLLNIKLQAWAYNISK